MRGGCAPPRPGGAKMAPPLTPPFLYSTKPNPNQIISVGSKPGMNGAGFQKGLTCESCHSQWGGGGPGLGERGGVRLWGWGGGCPGVGEHHGVWAGRGACVQ